MKALVITALILGSTAFPAQRDVESEQVLHFFVLYVRSLYNNLTSEHQ
jgi:hypothetical protein